MRRGFLILFVLNLALNFPGLVSSGNSGLFRALRISYARLNAGSLQSSSQTTFPSKYNHLLCSRRCIEMEWCRLWCKDPTSKKTCLFYNMYVVTQYQETNLEDALTCYLKDNPDYVAGSSIIGLQPNNLYYKRGKENLLDGIYNNVIEECYLPGHYFNPFFKIDLGSKKSIRRIMMVLQPNTKAERMNDIEVRVGREDLPEAEFDKYSFFGHFPGPSYAKQEIIFERQFPIVARYVLFRRFTNPDLCNPDGSIRGQDCVIQLCHIEIS